MGGLIEGPPPFPETPRTSQMVLGGERSGFKRTPHYAESEIFKKKTPESGWDFFGGLVYAITAINRSSVIATFWEELSMPGDGIVQHSYGWELSNTRRNGRYVPSKQFNGI